MRSTDLSRVPMGMQRLQSACWVSVNFSGNGKLEELCNQEGEFFRSESPKVHCTWLLLSD